MVAWHVYWCVGGVWACIYLRALARSLRGSAEESNVFHIQKLSYPLGGLVQSAILHRSKRGHLSLKVLFNRIFQLYIIIEFPILK